MNTKFLMMASVLFLGISGMGLTFLPAEISIILNSEASPSSDLLLQIIGALYLGFGMLNWMTKDNLMGGIYGRPLVIGNLMHFLVSFFALLRVTLDSENQLGALLFITIIYGAFSLGFGYLLMAKPKN